MQMWPRDTNLTLALGYFSDNVTCDCFVRRHTYARMWEGINQSISEWYDPVTMSSAPEKTGEGQRGRVFKETTNLDVGSRGEFPDFTSKAGETEPGYRNASPYRRCICYQRQRPAALLLTVFLYISCSSHCPLANPRVPLHDQPTCKRRVVLLLPRMVEQGAKARVLLCP